MENEDLLLPFYKEAIDSNKVTSTGLGSYVPTGGSLVLF